jgi:hypothetical protein
MKTILSALLALVAFTFTAISADAPPAQIATEADAVLKQVSQFYKGLKSANFNITQTIVKAMPGEEERTMKVLYSIAMERPNRFAGHLSGSRGEKLDFICDGKKAWELVQFQNKKFLHVTNAPVTLDALLSLKTGDGPTILRPLGHMGDLLLADPHKTIIERTKRLEYVGTEKIGDTECVHLRGGQRELDWDAWYEKGAKPVLRKYVTSPLKSMLANAKGEARAKLEGARIKITIECSDWKLDAALPAETFKFEPPKDAEIQDMTQPPASTVENRAAEPADELKGKPVAPSSSK